MVASARPATGNPSLEFDANLVRKLIQLGPRYTSYPTADSFSDAFGYRDYLQTVVGLRTRGGMRPLSLYVHIPFCESVCHYCSCNKVVTRDRSKAATYLSYLKHEIEMQGSLFAGMNQIEKLHIGGGTPTYLNDAQMGELMAHLRRHFRFVSDFDGEYAIEVDPRTVTVERVHALRKQGFNRISIGVQDFDPDVQQAVNRIQSEQDTLNIIRAAREACFRSVSIDLIYGLPKQNVITMAQTLNKVINASPDRIAVYNYVHRPNMFKPQRRIAEDDLPSLDARLNMFSLCIKRLTDAGYVYIGMDHFAKPSDDLAIAQRQGRLHRNFQGYSSHAEHHLVAFGVSGISAVAASYSENAKTLDEYYERIEQNELPIVTGVKLSMDDLLRRIIIQMLMCNFELSIDSIELAYPITFKTYFAAELEKLRELEDNGLVIVDEEWISVTPKGRLLIRNVCMVFDRYLNTACEAKTGGASAKIETQPLRYTKKI